MMTLKICGINGLYSNLGSNFVQVQPKLIAVSNRVTFVNPKAPLYPRLAQGKTWNEVSLCSTLLLLFI